MKNKKMLIAGASALALGVIGMGAFAYFADSADLDETAKVGTVDINVTGDLTHSGVTAENPVGLNNMNPGDNDPDVPDNYRPGTDHELTYTITNNGTKSVITRTIIRISGTYQETPEIMQNLTRNDLEEIIISRRATASTGVGATDADKNEGMITRLDSENAVLVDGKLVYTIGGLDAADSGDVLNGTEETETNGVGTSSVITLDLGLDKDVTATNSHLMGADLLIEIEVQAMQYRNTGDPEWATIFEDTYASKIPS